MVRVPRRLRKLNLDVQGAGHMEAEEENLHFNLEDQDERDTQLNGDLHLHPQFEDGGIVQLDQDNSENDDDITSELINILWPNGEARQILGYFSVKNMERLKNGKVIVETDENGVPNDRSGSLLGSYLGRLAQNSTFAPLHIPKWDDDLFVEPHESIITDVETKFIYPPETKHLTRDWVLIKVAKGWRSFKSRLKKRYYNPDVRTLNEISKNVPKGVNAYQWDALLAIWGKDQHKKLCEKNSQCAKQQRNPHTTGRKSHAMLFKEMREAKKAGKVHEIDVWDEAHKKKDADMKAVMVDISEQVDNDIPHAFKKTIDNSYGNLHPTPNNLQQLHSMSYTKVKDGCGKPFVAHEHMIDKVDMFEQVDNDSTTNGFDNNLHNSNVNVDATSNYVQKLCSIKCTNAKDRHANPSMPYEHTNAKKFHSSCSTILKESYSTEDLPYQNMRVKQSSIQSSFNQSRTNQNGVDSILPLDKTKRDQREVYLFSLTAINKDKVVAKGNLVVTDNTHVVGRNMLGNEYYGVDIQSVTNIGDERLPRPPSKNCCTLRDAIGCVIAWPRRYVKKLKTTCSTR